MTTFAQRFIQDSEILRNALATANVSLEEIEAFEYPDIRFEVTKFAKIAPGWGERVFSAVGNSMLAFYTREQNWQGPRTTYEQAQRVYLCNNLEAGVAGVLSRNGMMDFLKVGCMNRMSAEAKLRRMIVEVVNSSISKHRDHASLWLHIVQHNDCAAYRRLADYLHDIDDILLPPKGALMIYALVRLVWIDDIIASFHNINRKANGT